MGSSIVAFSLTRKIVSQQRDVPESAKQVIYHTLAIGHHVGVIDCLAELADLPLERFSMWLENLDDCPGKKRLGGVLKFGEIEVNSENAAELIPVFENPRLLWETTPVFFQRVYDALLQMNSEPALYLILRKRG